MAVTYKSLILATCLAMFYLTFVECQEQVTVESRQQKDNDDLTDTIKYLEKLDKYFSQIARPRFGRSDYKQPYGVRFGQQANNALAYNNNNNLVEQPSRNYGSFLDLVGSRLAQKYRDNY